MEEPTRPDGTPWGTNHLCPNFKGGCKYKGRGILMIHEMDDYKKLTEWSEKGERGGGAGGGIDYLNNPNILASFPYSFTASALFWKSRALNYLSDMGAWDLMTQVLTKDLWTTDKDKAEEQAKRLAFLFHASHCYRPPSHEFLNCGFTYTCNEGDSIEQLSTRYMMLPTEIAEANGMIYPYPNKGICHFRQTLLIPKCD